MENGKEHIATPITNSKDILDALETIKSIEMMGFALEEEKFKLKWQKAIYQCMDILRQMHDDLVSRLPPDVIRAEQAKAKVPTQTQQQGPPIITPETRPLGVA